jgi:hypothetical protein
MANLDGTGPEGKGPKTGRQLGKCEGAEPRGLGRGFGPCGCGARRGFGRRFNQIQKQEEK